MTAGNNGASTPENDDPFAYLYRSEDGEGGADGSAGTAPRSGGYGYPGPAAQPGVPRTSYNQVTRVGERQYGQQVPQQNYAQPGNGGRPGGYGQQTNAHYAAPETLGGGAHREPGLPAGGGRAGGGGRGPNSKGLLIGAISVVAAVVIGIGVAMASNGGDDDQAQGNAGPSASAGAGEQQEKDPAGKKEQARKPFSSKKKDAVTLRLDGGAAAASDIPNSESSSGSYVGGMTTPGATATWTVDVPKKGPYTLYVGYGVAGADANSTLVINGKPRSEPMPMKNYARAKEGEWDKGWVRTYSFVHLNEGTNTIQVACGQGNQCGFNLDWVQLKTGHAEK